MKKSLVEQMFTPRDLEAIETAVGSAESKTAGEIVIMLRSKTASRFSMQKQAAVERRATRAFMRLGIQQTRDRTGVLIFISLAEQCVVVRADKAINEKVLPGTWEKLTDQIIRGMKSQKPTQGICTAVEEAGNVLAEHFPRKNDDTNELTNGVQMEG